MKIVECPRDAMQGIHDWIPTEKKIAYQNALLQVGFDTLDFGSFVSAKAIPQMRDTADVLRGLDLSTTKTRLLAIVANERGAEDACAFPEIGVLGYPFSISETFQLRNTNATIQQSLGRVDAIKNLCDKHQKQLVIYVSMGFGNPYGDPWNVDIVQYWVDELADMGIKILSLSDTIGSSTPESISYLFKNLIPPYPDVEFGAHLHTQPHNWREKILAAYENGCTRFDAALRGYGGCPMAKDDLTGNMPTEHLLAFLQEKNVKHGLNTTAFDACMAMTSSIFP
jgi:hydroxymethylglutaryl-CoA lyase